MARAVFIRFFARPRVRVCVCMWLSLRNALVVGNSTCTNGKRASFSHNGLMVRWRPRAQLNFTVICKCHFGVEL